jgi:uncharacterized protein YndB with AHSA1/START domain
VPTARRSRTIAAPVDVIWEIVHDPHHLPRWWPRVSRVEDVEGDAFTEVMITRKGKTVRADFNLLPSEMGERALTWAQRVEGTPFARLLRSAETEVRLAPLAGYPSETDAEGRAGGSGGGGASSTEVTIELRQTLTGIFPRLGGVMVKRAAATTIEEALDGLERISV